MPDVAAFLKSQGLSDEEVQTIVSNPKFSGVYDSVARQHEEAQTALQNAQATKAQLDEWNKTQVIPYVQQADQKVAAAQARIAQQQTYLKSLKDAGYDIPDAMLGDAPASVAPKNDPVGGFDESKLNSALDSQGKAYMSLLSLSERARDLLGHGLDIEQEYDHFGKAQDKRPGETLRQYVSRKYDLDTLASKKAEAAEAERIKKIKDEAIEEYRKTNPVHVSPDTVIPRPSRFDRIVNDESRTATWQTKGGRDQATKERIQKYAGMVQ